MRMVVYNRERASVARLATDEPLSTTSIDGAMPVLFLDDSRDVILIQVAFVEAIDCVFGPRKTNDLGVARAPVSA